VAYTIDERIISSRRYTDNIFQADTVCDTLLVLRNTATKLFGVKGKMGALVSKKDKELLVMKFAIAVEKPLREIPGYNHNRITFKAEPVGTHQGLFGSGWMDTYTNNITVQINTLAPFDALVDAVKDNFLAETLKLRSVIRHELAHRMHMEHIKIDPEKRTKSWKYKRAMTAAPGADEYYGMPTEIIAHANHTIDLLQHGQDELAIRILTNIVFADYYPYRTTRQFIKYITKLSKDYKFNFFTRRRFRKALEQVQKHIHMEVEPYRQGKTIEDDDFFGLRNRLAKSALNKYGSFSKLNNEPLELPQTTSRTKASAILRKLK
jgi:hypothetical protein